MISLIHTIRKNGLFKHHSTIVSANDHLYSTRREEISFPVKVHAQNKNPFNGSTPSYF